jgi:hypothetical protein
MDSIFTQSSSLITTTGTVGNTLITDGTTRTTGIDLILGTLTLGLIALLFIIDHLLDLNHNELELEGIGEVI